ncbi:MAG: hypothetical protein KME29_05025 [Calothrix sp. FI2-JRJ7]|jgi:DNA-binding CsgD family transcriptional regulator|nr:hypothetical protein [Calothrix sp. FI2-JRJ7]
MEIAKHKLELGTLTPREFEATKLISEGLFPFQIAKKMHITLRTLDSFLYGARNKLKAENNVQLSNIFKEKGEALLSTNSHTQLELRRRQEIAKIIGCKTHLTVKYIKDNGFASALDCLNFLRTKNWAQDVHIVDTAPDMPCFVFEAPDVKIFLKYFTAT